MRFSFAIPADNPANFLSPSRSLAWGYRVVAAITVRRVFTFDKLIGFGHDNVSVGGARSGKRGGEVVCASEIGAGEGDCQGRGIAYPHLKVETKQLITQNGGSVAVQGARG
jgi:hypothetical protein